MWQCHVKWQCKDFVHQLPSGPSQNYHTELKLPWTYTVLVIASDEINLTQYQQF